MSTAELKARLFDLIKNFEDNDLLEEVYELLSSARKSPHSDWWDDLTEGHLARLQQSITDFKSGNVLSNDQVKANAKKWLSE